MRNGTFTAGGAYSAFSIENRLIVLFFMSLRLIFVYREEQEATAKAGALTFALHRDPARHPWLE